jgi:hypothetical protein
MLARFETNMCRACFLKGAAVEFLYKMYIYTYAMAFTLEKCAPPPQAPLATAKPPKKDDDKDDRNDKGKEKKGLKFSQRRRRVCS